MIQMSDDEWNEFKKNPHISKKKPLNKTNMKTQQEIEQLAEKWLQSANTERWGGEELGFINGYTQCQEDISKLLEKAIEFGYQLRNNNKPINSGIDWVKEFNSLNK